MNRDRSKAAPLGTLTGSVAFDYIRHEVAEHLKQCFCTGPKNGQPVCPCAMKGMQILNGRYVKIQDFGPVSDHPLKEEGIDPSVSLKRTKS